MNTNIGLEHPLAVEILSLRDALAQQQHATQQAAARVQEFAIHATSANTRVRQLTAENSALQHELDVLRAPRPSATPSTAEAELTLTLRRASARTEQIETALQESALALLNANAERDRTAGEIAAAYHLLETARSHEVELRSTLATRDIEKTAYELALTDYAALVRELEKRTSESEVGKPNGRTDGSVHPALKMMAAEDTAKIQDLTTELARAQADINTLQAQLDVERQTSEEERSRLAEAQVELEKRGADDKSAAALVERYMKFSQYHTDVLQRALTDQSARHEATRTSLAQRIEHLEHSLVAESARNRQLRSAVDTLVEDLARESAGRRREIRLRLAIAGREAQVEESLRRWERRTREHPKGQNGSDESAGLLFGLDELDQVRSIIDSLGAPIVFHSLADYTSEAESGEDALSGPLARILAADIAVEALTAELERETTRRMDLEREHAQSLFALDKPQVEISGREQALQNPLVLPSSTTISLVSAENTSRVSLPESSATSASIDDNPPIEPTPSAEKPPSPPLPMTPVPSAPLPASLSPSIPFPTAMPSPQSISAIPFPTNSPAQPTPKELSEPLALHDDPTVKELLAQLPSALQRYALFQNTFRDCHLALSTLKSELRQRPRGYLLTAVERLDDHNEDARVEVEIRIADEARRATGLEAMIHLGNSESEDVVAQLRAFVDGSAPEVHKALATATRKRDDLEHDIAAIKLAVHDPESELGASAAHTPEPPSPMTPSWAWRSPFRQSVPLQPVSPGPHSMFPTPQQALQRTISGNFGHSRTTSLGGGADGKDIHLNDPLRALGLRVPMPAYQPLSPPNVGLQLPSKSNHIASSPLTLERTRTTSMYQLGIGRRQSGMDLSKRNLSVVPTPKAESEVDSDDSVE
ncbi:hypothetical protein BDV93DRAFT_609160 [Ceratobasidium sp. AG-I]|nr:hypothetical protein BDV93DRAFT_609160 [Ceratobasidium sp. AG-I]